MTEEEQKKFMERLNTLLAELRSTDRWDKVESVARWDLYQLELPAKLRDADLLKHERESNIASAEAHRDASLHAVKWRDDVLRFEIDYHNRMVETVEQGFKRIALAIEEAGRRV